MILFNREVLFVHNPKTAGTSLLDCLQNALPNCKTAGVNELGTHHPHLDMAMGYACAVTGNKPQDFKRVLVGSRDPVDRERSMYAYFRSIHGYPGIVRELNADPLFLRFITLAHENDPDHYISRTVAQIGTCDVWYSRYYYRGGTFERPRLSILRISNLETDLHRALEGVELKAPVALEHKNATESGKVYFGQRAIEMIRWSYRWMDADGIPV